MPDPEAIQALRQELKRQHGQAFSLLNSILFREDPIGINFDDNVDEYEPEVSAILVRLAACQSARDVREVVHSEFVRWFDASTAGPPGKYTKIAQLTCEQVVPLMRADP